MLPLCLVASCVYAVAVCAAESPPIGSYSSQLRSSEYRLGSENYAVQAAGKPSEFGGSYVAADSPYSSSDSRYSSNVESISDPRASLSTGSSNSGGGSGGGGSFYKTKYASEAAVNAIRPSQQSSSLSASSMSADEELAQSTGYTSSQTSNYYGSPYGERGHASASLAGSGDRAVGQLHRPEYAAAQGSASQLFYPGYAASVGAEYHLGRPSSFSHGGLSSSSSNAADYPPSGHHASYQADEPTYHNYAAMSAQSPTGPYKTYVMSSPQSSNKYQTVLGAIKSLFGGGGGNSELATSSHPTYSFASPIHSSASHHVPTAVMSAGPQQASPSNYYMSGSPSSASAPYYSTAYSKNYHQPMRLANYGGSTSGSKIILVRDSSAVHGGATWPPSTGGSALGGSLLGGSSSYAPKNKIATTFSQGPYAAPSSLSYSAVSGPGGAFSASYPGSASYPSSRGGGSTFLGYSAN